MDTVSLQLKETVKRAIVKGLQQFSSAWHWGRGGTGYEFENMKDFQI